MADGHEQQHLSERVGLVVEGPDSSAVVEAIVAAEAAGVRTVWMTQGAAAPDTLAIYAAAATRTTSIVLGTAIVPTYPRHPLALAQQALTVADLAPGRLRLGVGPSHRHTMEGVYGLPMGEPLAHLREYVAVLRGLLWDGAADHRARQPAASTARAAADLGAARGGFPAGRGDRRRGALLDVPRALPARDRAA